MKVTQWFSCTTPPSKKGQFEMMAAHEPHAPICECHFMDGKWFGKRGLNQAMQPLDGLNNAPQSFVWRGLAEKPAKRSKK